MTRVGLCVVAGLVALSAHAGANSPEGALDPAPPVDLDPPDYAYSVQYGLTLGRDGYRESHLSGEFKLSEPFSMDVGLATTRITESDSAHELSAGFRWKLTPEQRLSVEGSGASGTAQLHSQNFLLEYRYDIASLWRSERKIELRIGLQSTRYLGPLGREAYTQRGVRAGVSLELSDRWSAGVSGSMSTKIILPAQIQQYARTVQSFLAQNRELLPQEYSAQVYAACEVTDSDRARFSFSRAKTLGLEAISNTPGLELAHDFNERWEGGLSISDTMTQGSKFSPQGGFDVTYRF